MKVIQLKEMNDGIGRTWRVTAEYKTYEEEIDTIFSVKALEYLCRCKAVFVTYHNQESRLFRDVRAFTYKLGDNTKEYWLKGTRLPNGVVIITAEK